MSIWTSQSQNGSDRIYRSFFPIQFAFSLCTSLNEWWSWSTSVTRELSLTPPALPITFHSPTPIYSPPKFLRSVYFSLLLLLLPSPAHAYLSLADGNNLLTALL